MTSWGDRINIIIGYCKYTYCMSNVWLSVWYLSGYTTFARRRCLEFDV